MCIRQHRDIPDRANLSTWFRRPARGYVASQHGPRTRAWPPWTPHAIGKPAHEELVLPATRGLTVGCRRRPAVRGIAPPTRSGSQIPPVACQTSAASHTWKCKVPEFYVFSACDCEVGRIPPALSSLSARGARLRYVVLLTCKPARDVAQSEQRHAGPREAITTPLPSLDDCPGDKATPLVLGPSALMHVSFGCVSK
jgi:hypothetical protein